VSAEPRPFRDRVADVARLVFPGIVATCLSIPSLAPGAFAFAIKGDFPLSAGEIGAMVAAFYLLSAVATQVSMPALARISPMAMARSGLLLSTSGVVVAAAVGTKPAVWVMCLAAGFANGLATPSANLLIALTVPARRRGLAFGLRVSAVPASGVVTATGAWAVAHTGLPWQGALAGAATLLLLVTAASWAGRSSPVRAPAASTAESRGQVRVSLRLIALGGLLAATACSTLSPFLVEGLIAAGTHPGDAALLLGLGAAAGVLARVTAGVLADWVPRPQRHLSAASLMLLTAAAGMGVLAVGSSGPVLAVATLLTFGIGWGWPGLLHHAAIALHPDHLAVATSRMQMGTFLGALFGPLGFGLVVDLVSFRAAWTVAAVAAVVASAVIWAGQRRVPRPGHTG